MSQPEQRVISVEVLKETAMGLWESGRGIPAGQWHHYMRGGLYDWAAETQEQMLGSRGIPPKKALLEHLAPPAKPLVLVPHPTPPAGPIAAQGPISKRRLTRGRNAAAAVHARNERTQAIAFSPHDFVQFALPHKQLDATVYERLNGRLRITLTTRNGYKIPYGQDRLYPLWLATAFNAAGQPADNVIRFRSAGDILAAFRQTPDGESRQRLRERMQRWQHTTIDVDASDEDGVHHLSYGLIEETHLWFQRKGGATNQYSLWQNVIKLGSKFADGLRKNAIPVDFETVVALRDIPGALDLYIWQAHRSWELYRAGAVRPTAVPIPSLLAQLGTQSPPRKAKQLMKGWQNVVKDVWRNCPNYIDWDRNLFMLHAGQAVFERSTASLPGVVPVPPVPLRPLVLGDPEAADLVVFKRETDSI